ncbi:O-antigen ligase family protein [Allorhizobium undicola]|uniref:O-antigen ligase family protein n=1 Tax=Allorhizobium undicola TaxID=78527 RepID=UPI003D34E47E
MRIPKAIILDSNRNEPYAMVATGLSLFVFAYSSIFGQVSILAYYGLWFLPVLVNYRKALGDYRRFLWIYAFAVLAFLSTFWSAAPGTSLRASLQYLSHIFCALVAVRVVGLRSFTRGTIFGTGLVLLYSLAFGRYQSDALDGSFSFVGAFESKNQLGFYASLSFYFAFAAVVIQAERNPLLLSCYAVISAIAGYCLIASQSATSVLTVIVIIMASLIMKAVSWLTPRHRTVLFTAGAIFGTVAVLAFIYGGGFALILGAFGKDTTLTGRTYLWGQGIEAIKLNPLLGTGYQAYWVQGFAEAERLWFEFYIATRTGFHFHNTYIETTVELGLTGLLLLCILMLNALISTLRQMLTNARDPEAATLFGLTLMLLIRSFVEIDTLNPYQVGSFLLYFVVGRMALRRSVSKRRRSPRNDDASDHADTASPVAIRGSAIG